MLEEEDAVSKALIIFISDYIRGNAKLVNVIFSLIESGNSTKRKNGLEILSHIFNPYDDQQILDSDMVEIVSLYLLKRLADEDISIRNCAAVVFSKMDIKVVADKLLPLYLSKSEKERSAAHEALTRVMELNTENANAFLSVVDCIKDINLPNNNDLDGARKHLAERVMSFLPSYISKLSPQATQSLIISITQNFFENNTDPILVFIMNKVLNFVLSVEMKPNLTSEDEYILNSKKESLVVLLNLIIERMKTQTEECSIFEKLSPLLVLKTLPVSIFYFMNPNYTNDNICLTLMKILNVALVNNQEVDEIRKVSAEAAAKIPPRLSLDSFCKSLRQNLAHTDVDSLRKAKVFLYCICQNIALYEEDPFIITYITEPSHIMDSLKPCLSKHAAGEEMLKIQQGCVDCVTMMTKYILNYSQHGEFIRQVMDSLCDPKESAMLRIYLSNAITKCSQILPLKHQLTFANIVIPRLQQLLLSQRESLPEMTVLFCSCMQSLLNLIFQLKSAIHPFSKGILDVISKLLSDEVATVRLSSLKVLGGMLAARDDILIDYKTVFEFEILKKVKGMASIESNTEVQKLARELCKIMGLSI